MRNLLILFFLIFFSGCSLIKEPTKININSYALEATEGKIYNTNNFTILINKPKISRSFNTKDILYSKEHFYYEVYKKNRWIETPSHMVKEELIEKLRNSNIFANVIDLHSHANANYILETSISKIYHKYENQKSFAIFKGNFKLIYKNKILKSINFDKKILCEDNTPYGFVKAINIAFNDSLEQLINKLVK